MNAMFRIIKILDSMFLKKLCFLIRILLKIHLKILEHIKLVHFINQKF